VHGHVKVVYVKVVRVKAKKFFQKQEGRGASPPTLEIILISPSIIFANFFDFSLNRYSATTYVNPISNKTT
jgi:hypothetical protein